MSRASEISDEAADWLIRLEARTSAELWDGLQAWLDADPRHRAAFVRLRVAWNRADVLKNLQPLDGTIDPDLLAGANLAPATLAAKGLQPLQGRARKRSNGLSLPNRRRWLAAAATVAAAGVIAWLIGFTGWKSYETGIGGREQIALRDGSTVKLNTNTQLRTRLTSSRRDIMLTRGEALFHVAHDSTRPFYVIAGATLVRAVGTEFSVRLRDADHVDVLVTEGRVAIGAAQASHDPDSPMLVGSASEVSDGEAARAKPGTLSVTRLAAKDVTRKLAWTAGHLAFQGETLAEAVQEFNRYNQRQITVADPSIERVQVGGTFRTTDPDSFVAALQRSFGIQALRDSGGIRLVAGDKLPP